MEFNSCFISYRHPASEGSRERKLIDHVVKAVKDHIEMYTHNHPVYFDDKRLVPGYQYDERIAEAICRSACMVIVYWPAYLESDYCRKEIAAMLEIERKRQLILGDEMHGCRLFVPIILHGKFEELPSDVTEACHYLDYKAQATKPDFNIGDDEKMSEKLYGVAEYIKSLCDKLKNNREAVFRNCGQYAFPAPEARESQTIIQPAPHQPFPGR